MPRKKIDTCKNQAALAHSNVMRAIDHTAAVAVEFADVHPELANALEVVVQSLTLADSILFSFAETAWGIDPVTWHQWGTKRERE